ncbi:hypothetical protein CBL_01828 [Carabus blaptoides fortunei]
MDNKNNNLSAKHKYSLQINSGGSSPPWARGRRQVRHPSKQYSSCSKRKWDNVTMVLVVVEKNELEIGGIKSLAWRGMSRILRSFTLRNWLVSVDASAKFSKGWSRIGKSRTHRLLA